MGNKEDDAAGLASSTAPLVGLEKEERATFWDGPVGVARLYFGIWIPALARQGMRGQPVEEQDYPPRHWMFDSTELMRRAEALLAAAERRGERPTLLGIVARVGRGRLLVTLGFGVIQGLSSTVLRPTVLSLAIRSSTTLSGAGTSAVVMRKIGVSMLFGGAVFLEGLSFACAMLNVQIFALSSFVIASTLVARRAAQAPGGLDVSETNLVGNDLIQCIEMSRFVLFLPSSLLAIAGGVFILTTQIGGLATLAGVGTLFTVLFINTQLAGCAKSAQKVNLKFADQRLELVGEALRGIHSIKLFGWEAGFLDRVAAVRLKECASIFRFRCAQVVSTGLGRSSPSLSACTAFVAATYVGNRPLDAVTMFAAVSVFQALRVATIMLPQTYMYILVIKVSLDRLDHYLFGGGSRFFFAEEPAPSDVSEAQTALIDSSSVFPGTTTEGAEGSILAETEPGTVLRFPGTTKSAFEGQLRVEAGQLVGVVGSVGSGKSSLISALLNRFELHAGSMKRCSSVAVAPQKSFTVSATVRENITLGRDYDPAHFDRVVKATQLTDDFKQFLSEDLTEVGERGVTLSGGQQARVTLARALFAQPQLLLADDPLSALDVSVGRRVFEEAIRAYPNHERACVCCLNQMHLARRCDFIIVLEGQRIVESGKPDELLLNDGPFAKLVRNKSVPEEQVAVVKEAVVVAASRANEGEMIKTGKLVVEEKRSKQAISARVYGDYVRSFGKMRFAGTFLTCAVAYACFALEGLSLQRWVNVLDVDDRDKRKRREGSDRSERLMIRYVAFVLAGAVGIVSTSVLFSVGGVRASKSLHSECLGRVLRAPLSYFDATPTGRLTSRFSADLAVVDLQISLFVDHVAQMGCQVLVFAIVVCAVAPPMVALLAFSFFFYGGVVQMADAALRNAKRLANIAFAPLMTNVTELVASRCLVEKGGQRDIASFFLTRHAPHAERVAHLRYCTEAVPAWANLTVSCIAALCAFGTCLTVLLDSKGRVVSKSQSALALTYSVLLPYFFSVLMFQVTTLRLYFASLERLLELREVPVEKAARTPMDPPVDKWPLLGGVVMEKVSLRYRPNLPLAVIELSLVMRPREHIGLVGRTGAGKSTLAALLLRLVEPCNGRVLVDGIDLATLGLHTLRRRISMIPQTAVLLSGTVDRNIDPFEEHDDDAKKKALSEAGLSLDLDHSVGKDGSAISAGERQLLGVARALLRSSRLVIMDEPSSNVDETTDAKLQLALRKAFKRTTTLVIAHRLETIIDVHTILTLDQGRLMEKGAPADLLEDPQSRLSSMVAALPTDQITQLRQRARTARRYEDENDVTATAN